MKLRSGKRVPSASGAVRKRKRRLSESTTAENASDQLDAFTLLKVFDLLRLDDLQKCLQVCRKWNSVARRCATWRRECEELELEPLKEIDAACSSRSYEIFRQHSLAWSNLRHKNVVESKEITGAELKMRILGAVAQDNILLVEYFDAEAKQGAESELMSLEIDSLKIIVRKFDHFDWSWYDIRPLSGDRFLAVGLHFTARVYGAREPAPLRQIRLDPVLGHFQDRLAVCNDVLLCKSPDFRLGVYDLNVGPAEPAAEEQPLFRVQWHVANAWGYLDSAFRHNHLLVLRNKKQLLFVVDMRDGTMVWQDTGVWIVYMADGVVYGVDADQRLFKSPAAEKAYKKASTSMPFRCTHVRVHAKHLFVANLNNVAVFDCANLNQLRRAEVGCRLAALQMIGWIHGPVRCSECESVKDLKLNLSGYADPCRCIYFNFRSYTLVRKPELLHPPIAGLISIQKFA